MSHEEVLKILGETGALLEGHFELRSGLHSDRFFQCANVLRYPGKAGELCAVLADKIKYGISNKLCINGVIAPALGGIIVGYEIARLLDVRSIFAEKQDDKLVLRRFKINKGERFIVAEDVITMGGRVRETVDIVEKYGGEVVAIALLVDRSGGKVSFDYDTFSLIQMEPITYNPSVCPLCKQGMTLVHPGS